MSRTNWKQVERDAAALFGARRFPANMGGPLDFESHHFVGQVKNPRVMSLANLERLALEMDAAGVRKDKIGVVVVKRSAGPGTWTPKLVLMTEVMWENVYRLLPEPLERQR